MSEIADLILISLDPPSLQASSDFLGQGFVFLSFVDGGKDECGEVSVSKVCQLYIEGYSEQKNKD